MFGLSAGEATVILLVGLLVLGPKRLPMLIQHLGQALRALQRTSSDIRSALDGPLREVREPLEHMQQDLYQTVHHFERQVNQAAATIATTSAPLAADLTIPATPASLPQPSSPSISDPTMPTATQAPVPTAAIEPAPATLSEPVHDQAPVESGH